MDDGRQRRYPQHILNANIQNMLNSRRGVNPYQSRRRSLIKPILSIPFLIVAYYAYRLSFNANPLTVLDLGIRPTVETLLTEDYGFHLSAHPKDRQDRFPAVEERVRANSVSCQITYHFYLCILPKSFLLKYHS